MRDRGKILFDFMRSGDYRRCPNSTKLLNLEVLLDNRDLLVEIKDGLIDVENSLAPRRKPPWGP